MLGLTNVSAQQMFGFQQMVEQKNCIRNILGPNKNWVKQNF